MATNKIAMKFRSITYPNHESPPSKNKRGKLQRMKSFDYSQSETATTTSKPTTSTRREVSVEGRIKAKQFQHTHSASNTTNTLAPGQKLLRFSDECWCSPSPDHEGRPQAKSVGCLVSPKSKPGTVVRLSAGGTVERLVDWQRESPDRLSVSPSHRYESYSRYSGSKERRSEREASAGERRSHFSASASLPQHSKSSSSTDSATPTATTPTTPPVSSEGRSRRSQFRRAWSLFSLTCDKEIERDRREKSPQQRILRPPTRHIYRRGLSGLPIECSSRYLGLAY
ncbi:hypothetical protein SK128_010735 [Halocaridina rubra]|uniref:Uncharacterized protein n=1 Tax=Halocaridina rubra TaxID=373956 RepID=A0AAN9A9R0_HALRR